LKYSLNSSHCVALVVDHVELTGHFCCVGQTLFWGVETLKPDFFSFANFSLCLLVTLSIIFFSFLTLYMWFCLCFTKLWSMFFLKSCSSFFSFFYASIFTYLVCLSLCSSALDRDLTYAGSQVLFYVSSSSSPFSFISVAYRKTSKQ
jgi:hypothetical protein